VVVVNTCSVTASADQAARQAIRRLARVNPAAVIVVTGCYATRRPEEVRDLPGVMRVVPNDDKAQLVSFVRGVRRKPDLLQETQSTAERFGDGEGSCGATIEPGVAGRTAFTLRVQTGCAEPCSYCIIPTTRGTPASVPLELILRDVERIVSAGFKEVVLTGVHLGSYGRDLARPSSLFELLSALLDQASCGVRLQPDPDGRSVRLQPDPDGRSVRQPDPDGRSVRLQPDPDGRSVRLQPDPDGRSVRLQPDLLFRISSLEPMDCTPGIVDLVASSRIFARHFHLPLQHASDRVLRSMRRPYTIDYYAALVDRVRRSMPDASIGSDLIVGFPGETDADFECLASYLEGSPLTHLHVFPYSDRPGTPAAAMPDKVHGLTVRERARRLREISGRLLTRFRESQIGSVHRALTLEDGSLALTGNYLKIRIPRGHGRNEWVDVRVTSQHDGELLGG
jgi:threonylcarbamoyladenosine tRNA methylthiotransferase MtaB